MAHTAAFDQYNPSIMISTPASYPAQGHRPESANNGRSPSTNACRKAAVAVRFNAGVKRRALSRVRLN